MSSQISAVTTEDVLSTTELLEMILLHLTVKDLLKARGTSKVWADLIHTSIYLRQALFLDPCGATIRRNGEATGLLP